MKKSKKKPNKKIVIITNIRELTFAPGISVRKFSTIRSPPNPRKTKENKDAPIKIKKTIEFIFKDSIHTELKILKLTFFFNYRNYYCSQRPSDADSVGVAIQKELNLKLKKLGK